MINKILDNNISNLISSSKTVDTIGHQGLKGTAREQYLSDFLSKYVPHQWGIAQGKIQDSLGNISNECDVVIYDRNSLPISLAGTSISIFPIESVKYVLEVKSTLRSSEIKDTIEKFNNLKKMYSRNEKQPIRVLFAFDSDLKKKDELKRLKEIDNEFHSNPATIVLVVIGKGYWFRTKRVYDYEKEQKQVFTSLFYKVSPSECHIELKSFLFGLLDTLNPELPSFSNYFTFGPDLDTKYHQCEEEIIRVVSNNFTPVENEGNDIKIKVTLAVVEKDLNGFDKKNANANITENLVAAEELKNFPILEIILTNVSDQKILIDSCSILTSKGLKFFKQLSSEELLEYPIILHANKSITIKSQFICFPKQENSNRMGGSMIYRRGDKYGDHNFKFNTPINEDYAVIEVKTINKECKHSEPIKLSNFLNSKENNHLDFLLKFNGLIRFFSDKKSGEEGMFIDQGRIIKRRESMN